MERTRSDQERSRISAELEFHFAETVDALVGQGWTEEAARVEAERRFGNRERYQRNLERIARGRSAAMKDSIRTAVRALDPAVLVRDLRYALRTLVRTPGFTVPALLALTLDPDRLVRIFDSYPEQGEELGPGGLADLRDWKDRARSFASLDAFARNRFTLTGEGDAEQVLGMGVTAAFFDTLGARPLLGRAFAPGEDQPGRPRTVVLSERLWRRRYHSADILGRQIVLNARPATVVGVMPASFEFGSRLVEIWATLTLTPPTRRGPFFLYGVARLKPGISVDQAAVEMDAIARDVERANPKDYTQLRFPVVPLRETIVGDIRPLLWLLAGAVGVVLLIAVANVANLMLARATSREREVALRLSIGAGPGQLLRQFMTECVLLALTGATLGAGLSFAAIAALARWGPRDLPRAGEIAVDVRALGFTLLASLLSAILFGVGPALAASRAAPNEALKAGGRGGASRRHGRARDALVVAQITLSVLLLIGAGLLIRSFTHLGRVDPGFHRQPDRLLTMLVSPSGPRYAKEGRGNEALNAFWQQLLDRVRGLPGVAAASIAVTIPPDRLAFTDGYEIERKPTLPGADHPAVPVVFVSHDYFATLGIPVLRGRVFDRRDTATSPAVTIISAAMARRHFPGEDPIGQRLKHGGRSVKNRWMEIIGVVGDVKYESLDAESTPAYYELSVQVPFWPMWLLVATRGEAGAAAAGVRDQVRRLDPEVAVDRVSTMAQAISESVSLPRFRSVLMTMFAATALALAAIGIYGVIAYSVAQRTQEIGVRMALGASQAGVLMLVIGQGSRLAVIGVAIGLLGASGLTRVLERMLFGVSPLDTVTFAGAALLLGLIAILASFVPAYRAARIDPMTALRHE
jgi:putative ABC transport system permease protein